MPLEIGSVHADGQFYDAARMLGAQQAFAPSRRSLYLRGLQPQVLALQQLLTLTLRLDAISGPPSLGQPSRARTMRGFNPSIAPAPTGLCPRCAYVATVCQRKFNPSPGPDRDPGRKSNTDPNQVRVDALHQCDCSSDPRPNLNLSQPHPNPNPNPKPNPILYPYPYSYPYQYP